MAYVYSQPSSDLDTFNIVADGLNVGRLALGDDGWLLQGAGPLAFGPIDIGHLDPDDAQRAAVDWMHAHQRAALDELFDY